MNENEHKWMKMTDDCMTENEWKLMKINENYWKLMKINKNEC